MNAGDEVAGRYRLEELAGHGPMSTVWRAHDKTLDRTVALKMLAPTADLERFRREARAVASLAHEHVMGVYDYGEDAAGPFMALEWLPGGTLETRLRGGALPHADAGRIATGIASGLARRQPWNRRRASRPRYRARGAGGGRAGEGRARAARR